VGLVAVDVFFQTSRQTFHEHISLPHQPLVQICPTFRRPHAALLYPCLPALHAFFSLLYLPQVCLPVFRQTLLCLVLSLLAVALALPMGVEIPRPQLHLLRRLLLLLLPFQYLPLSPLSPQTAAYILGRLADLYHACLQKLAAKPPRPLNFSLLQPCAETFL
jgi:hypothetical protein